MLNVVMPAQVGIRQICQPPAFAGVASGNALVSKRAEKGKTT